MVFIVASLVLALSVLVHCQDEDPCNPIVVDECGYKIYDNLMQPSKIPVNDVELKAYCGTFEDGEKCLREKIKVCPKIVQQKTADDYFQSLLFTHDDLCKADNGKKLLVHTPCIKEKVLNFTCTNTFFNQVEASLLEKKDDRISAVCCAMVRYEKCYVGAVTDNCGKVAARSLRSDLHGFILFLVEKCLPLFSNTEECDKITPKTLPADTRKVMSVLPSFLEIIASSQT